MKNIQIKKIILLILPVLFVFSIGKVKADTYQMYFVDTSIRENAYWIPGYLCNDYKDDGKSYDDSGTSCPSLHVPVILTTTFLPSISYNRVINGYLNIGSVQVCATDGSNCFDINSLYGGNAKLHLRNYDLFNKYNLLGLTNNKNYTYMTSESNFPLFGTGVDLKEYNSSLYWHNMHLNQASNPSNIWPTYAQDYKISIPLGFTIQVPGHSYTNGVPNSYNYYTLKNEYTNSDVINPSAIRNIEGVSNIPSILVK